MTAGPGAAIWLASYPKSGNTWARLALYSLQAGGAQVALHDISQFAGMPTGRVLFESVLEADSGNLTDAELEALRPALHDECYGPGRPQQLIKVHDTWFRTACGRPVFDRSHSRGSIYILRDPRDVAISWARFSNRSIDWAIGYLAERNSRLNTTRRRMERNISQFIGDWSTHVTSWIDEASPTPLLVRYEDMHADLDGVLRRIAAHLDWPVPTDAAIAGAIAATRFDRLAEQERVHGFAEIPDSASRFFVSGRAGGWRDILTPEQAATIERDHGAVMRRFGYL